ncbi:hypothetical protein E2C01_060451 [Portunus trituberculatus]|uniref:Uncharacterized protein n=1 Tax=Portunus trituberculatus TaxID=210409 RepID=A0A5B7HC39_PORTR|nr:hypothetical protein [Portunus trituberculatus]
MYVDPLRKQASAVICKAAGNSHRTQEAVPITLHHTPSPHPPQLPIQPTSPSPSITRHHTHHHAFTTHHAKLLPISIHHCVTTHSSPSPPVTTHSPAKGLCCLLLPPPLPGEAAPDAPAHPSQNPEKRRILLLLIPAFTPALPRRVKSLQPRRDAQREDVRLSRIVSR